MAPAKRRAATPKSRKSTKAATEDSTELLGPDGEPVGEEGPTGDAGGDSAPPTETGQEGRGDRVKKQSPGRSRGLYPLPVWPD